MSRRHELPSSRRHVMIFDDDWAWLEANWGAQSANPVGVGNAIRTLVHLNVKRQKMEMLRRLDSDTAAKPTEDGARS